MRLIDAKVIEDFDGAKLKITRINGPLDTDAAYIRGYNAGMQLIVNEAKKAPTISLHGGWKNAKTEPPPPNTDVEVYCKALGVTVGYHSPLMDEWLTYDHRTLRNVTHWRPIPPPPPEAEP